ncbi:Hypothetical predicted protein [Marmota monax]|uniref:Uncharacterized protein n=1 Tax=Marmota monax TaxID=9995 RepID=A0A5E4ASJ3_MARMO|nr:hypothetical protein GHT09_018055 [Marmota monax]VTJ60165.1 Hypothetical predicted protein [Marmota monax]
MAPQAPGQTVVSSVPWPPALPHTPDSSGEVTRKVLALPCLLCHSTCPERTVSAQVHISLLPLHPALESGLREPLGGTSVPSPQMSSYQPPDPDAVLLRVLSVLEPGHWPEARSPICHLVK